MDDLRRQADMDKRICADPSCERVVKTAGLCGMHYARKRRADPNRPRCADDDCARAAVSKGLCDVHYRWLPDRLEKHRAASREWGRRTYPERAPQMRAYMAANADRYRVHRRNAMRRWRAANPELAAQKIREWADANPDRWNELRKQASQARRARKRGTQVEPIDLSLVLAEHGPICHLCDGDIEPEDLHFDHVIPLARHGTHTYDNIRPAHAGCNLKKGCRVD